MAGSQGLSARCIFVFAFFHFAVVSSLSSPSYISCPDLAKISNYGSCQADKGLEHEKLIVMLQVGDGYTDFFANWFRFANTYINRECMQILAIIDDKKTANAMKKLKKKNRWRWTFLTAMGSDFPLSDDSLLLNTGFKGSGNVSAGLEPIFPYGSAGYTKSMSLRPRAVNHFLQKDCAIVFTDIDLIWRKDIFKKILNEGKSKETNMYGFEDVRDDKPKPAQLCGGFMYMNPTPWTKTVIKKWSDKLSKHPGTNQGPLNDLIKEAKGGYGSMVLLPRAWYANPKTADSRDDDQLSIVHANWLIGKLRKKKFLKKMKLWQEDDDKKSQIEVGSSTDATAKIVDSTGDAETATDAVTMTHDSAGLASPIMRHE